MSQGLLPYTVETVPDLAGLTSRAGLSLVLETMRALGLPRVIREHVHSRARQSGYTETETLEALVVLLAAGGDCLDDIAVLQADGGLGRLLARQLPSADTLRHFLYACHDEERILAARWALFADRPDETVHCTEVEFTPGTWKKDDQPLRYLALRFRKKQGQLFASGADTKYLALGSNRWELPPAALVRWHWQKAGTIELVHAITKNELGAAVPPCGRFGANAAWYRLSLLTYNVLSALKSLALPPALSTARHRLALVAQALPAG
jgi:hypothetical protein